MLRLFVGIMLLFNLNLIFLAEAKAEPKAVFPELDHSFGKVKEGEKAIHIFRIINIGDEPLRIKQVMASCGCTATALSKKIVLPGEEGEIKVVFNSSGRVGEFEKNVRVVTNDPKKPETMLKIRGTVVKGPSPSIKIINRKIDLGVISLNIPHSFAISIRNTGSKDLIVKSIKNYRGKVFLDSEVIIPPERRKIIHLTYHPKKWGVINESLTIYSNDPSRPRSYVFLSGYVEKGERITIIRRDQYTFVVSNNTSEEITVTPWNSIEYKQVISPYKSKNIKLKSTKANNEIIISLGFKKEGG